MTPFHPLNSPYPSPERFTYPFCYEPHPLCIAAADELKRHLATEPAIGTDARNGKMFGVLVVSDETGRRGFLAAYSGLLAGRNDWPYFVPPVFDAQQPDGYFKQKEREISRLAESGDAAHRSLSQSLQRWLFHQYRMLNALGEEKDLVEIWHDYHSERVRHQFPLPPGGSGDCCAPKLLQYAYRHRLHPLAMAEFWMGRSPRGEIRYEGQFYPACRGKCLPILTFMLRGLDVDPNPLALRTPLASLCIVYDEPAFAVVDKPAGLLSVPGKDQLPSVVSLLRERWPEAECIRPAHRLDMDTSGLLVVAKTEAAYAALQAQFVRHEVTKRYEALLTPSDEGRGTAGECNTTHLPKASQTIRLPLRPDPLDRPRQVVDWQHGKTAVTEYAFTDDNRVSLWPHTGRTHQLRVHCAHPEGLGRPIVGDALYGHSGDRLCLHAAELTLRHPADGHELHFVSPPPF
ncbi:MAG: RluA family pseudouridine synthase [Prevotella sp.]|nr:RluA family pseudouridine synthase [Prevotella sp.]